jgi:hypothetical protein
MLAGTAMLILWQPFSPFSLKYLAKVVETQAVTRLFIVYLWNFEERFNYMKSTSLDMATFFTPVRVFVEPSFKGFLSYFNVSMLKIILGMKKGTMILRIILLSQGKPSKAIILDLSNSEPMQSIKEKEEIPSAKE